MGNERESSDNGFLKIDKMLVEKNKVECYFSMSENIEKFFSESKKMFIEYEEDISMVPESILVIPFINNVLQIGWMTNSRVWVKEVDKSYYDATFNIKRAYQEMYPNVKLKGGIIAARVIDNKHEIKKEAFQLFSGGLDAITTHIRIKDLKPDLIYIHGWEENQSYEKAFKSEKETILKYSKDRNLSAKFIKSNFATFTKTKIIDKTFKNQLNDSWWHGMQHGGAFITHAIPLAYKYGVENIYIASSNSLNGERITCSSDPSVDIEYRYSTGGVIHDGFELNRQEKIGVLTKEIFSNQNESNQIQLTLKVCSFTEKNCCKCEKCFRTIIALVAEGLNKKGLEKLGFIIEGDLKDFFNNFMNENLQFFGAEFEEKVYWQDTRKRIKENIAKIQETEFCEWFLEYDFLQNRKKAIRKYRAKNFISILKRKVLK